VLQVETIVSTFRVGVTRKKKESTPSGYVAYYRVSTPRQGESGLGLDAQQAAVEAHVRARNSQVLGEFTEVESGKRHENRPQLAAAIAHAKRIGATLLIARLSRLARNVHFISGLMESAAAFEACDIPGANKFTIHIMAAVAENERETISASTKGGLAAAKREIEKNGFRISPNSGRRFTKLGNPRWQESIGRARAARKTASNAALVSTLIHQMREDNKSLREIAQALNAAGLRTPRGGEWHANTVLRALPPETSTD
jgi:DNA invertase Pin-like site-specific DNA recombinase